MRIVRSIAAMQRLAARNRSARVRVGFVPTMGCLHLGHVSLIARARHAVGRNGQVIVSIYVNPTQFGPKEDFAKYPRDLDRDARACRRAGVNVIFAPSDREMYPADTDRAFSTYVNEDAVSKGLEGASRPTHFRGVTTVVTKLFHIVDPDVAVFGQKDFQQAAVIERMVRDLNFRTKIVTAPTLREPDGLAMSSRNQYLSAEERPQAVALWGALQLARQMVRSARTGVPSGTLERAVRKSIGEHPSTCVEYVSFFEPSTLRPVRTVVRGTHMALAVFLGRTRLIDNARL